jgi:hypothetical protein
MMPFTTTYSSFVTTVYSPLPCTVPTVETMSSPDTVMTQSPSLTDEANVRGKDADEWHGPAKMM